MVVQRAMSAEKQSKGVSHITAGEEVEGQRIDNFLMAQDRSVPKSLIYKVIRKGEVRVNKKRVKQTYRVQEGDIVRIPPMSVRAKALSQPNADKAIEQWVVYEDDDLLVINKPAGVAVHGGSGVSFGVIEQMRVARPLCKRLELAHRLDRDTSGVLLLTKKLSVLRKVQKAMQSDEGRKYYLCAVHGRFKGKHSDIEAPLKKFTLASGERVVRVSREGKECKTGFSRLHANEAFSVLRAQLFTGRTHQIRVHCAHSGYPIVGDKKYGIVNKDKALQGLDGNRMYLHAYHLSFVIDGKTHQFFAPVPSHWSRFLEIEEKAEWPQVGLLES